MTVTSRPQYGEAIGTVGKDGRVVLTDAWEKFIDELLGRKERAIGIVCSDETTSITAGAGKLTFRMPMGLKLTEVRASLTDPQVSGATFTVDIRKGGASILSTKLTVDNGEESSTTAAAPAVISEDSLEDDAEIRIDVTQVGDGTAAGLKVWLIGTEF